MDELLAKVKLALRIKHSALDDEILDNIQACLSDLRMHGIVHKDETDTLIQNAIKLYCKSEFTDDLTKAEKYAARYRELRDCLKVAEDYGWVDEVVENAD